MASPLTLVPAVKADYPSLAAAGRAAFEADRRRYGVGPSIYENPAFLLPLLEKDDGAVQKLMVGETLIGVAITSESAPGVRRLGCLCLTPEWQGRGYGALALQRLEAGYPAVAKWTLDTPADNARNRRFYERAGYRVVGENTLPVGPKLVLFEKRM